METVQEYWAIILAFLAGAIAWGETRYKVARHEKILSIDKLMESAANNANVGSTLIQIRNDTLDIKTDLRAHIKATAEVHENIWSHIGKLETDVASLKSRSHSQSPLC